MHRILEKLSDSMVVCLMYVVSSGSDAGLELLEPVSLRHVMSQLKDIVTHTQK